jgi:mannan endo-1,4-beta-mannosidase
MKVFFLLCLAQLTTASDPVEQLRHRLMDISASDAFLFGHHDDNVKGQTWFDCAPSDAPNCTNFNGTHSDTKLATGQLAGLVEFDMSWMEIDPKVDYGPAAQAAFDAGAVVSLDFHFNNPVTAPSCHPITTSCGSFYDHRGNPIKELLPGGKANAVWNTWLDILADFVLRFPNNAFIFRPMHEMTLTSPTLWWWSNGTGVTPSEYRAAISYTRSYLVNQRNVHNLLFAYAPAKPSILKPQAFPTAASPDAYYPGDDVIDIVCMDSYDEDNDFTDHFISGCELVVSFAEAHGKIPAVCEYGIKGGMQNSNNAHFHTEAFLNPILRSKSCQRLAYTNTWNNGPFWRPPGPHIGKKLIYWVPTKGQPDFDDFLALHASKHTLLQAMLYLHRQHLHHQHHQHHHRPRQHVPTSRGHARRYRIAPVRIIRSGATVTR